MKDYENSQLKSNTTGSAVTLILAFLVVHGLLFGFDLANSSSLLSGDRSASRNATIAYVFNVEQLGDNNSELKNGQPMGADADFSDRMLGSGHAGDYFIQGSILALSNHHILILLQLALALLSTLCFFALLKHLGLSAFTATVSTLFYIVLPGSLLPPHQLSTEAVCIPSIVIACYLLVISSERKDMCLAFMAGLLALSLAIFVRPQLILFPFLLLFIYCLFSAKKLNAILLTVLPLSLLFSAAWMFVVVSNDGHFSFGGDDRSIGRSFHDTTEQMAMAGEFEFDSNAYESRKMPFDDFAQIVADHTYYYFRQRTLSMINFIVNTGAYSLAVRHLDYFNKNEEAHYWQRLRASSGIYESVIEIVNRGPGFTALIIGSTLAWCMVVVLSIVGLSAFIKDKNVKKFAKVLLLSLAAYQVTIVLLLSVGGRWQHRSVVDFIIVILAIYGLKSLQQHLITKNARAVAAQKIGTQIGSLGNH